MVVAFSALANAALFLLNIVPAFPLDGGRIARSFVWQVTGDRHRATKFAAYMGQGFALLMVGWGVYVLVNDLRNEPRPDQRPVVDRAGLDDRRRGARGDRPERHPVSA